MIKNFLLLVMIGEKLIYLEILVYLAIKQQFIVDIPQ